MAAIEDEKYTAFGHTRNFPYLVIYDAGVITTYKLVATIGFEFISRRLASAVSTEIYDCQIRLHSFLHGGYYGRGCRLFVFQHS